MGQESGFCGGAWAPALNPWESWASKASPQSSTRRPAYGPRNPPITGAPLASWRDLKRRGDEGPLRGCRVGLRGVTVTGAGPGGECRGVGSAVLPRGPEAPASQPAPPPCPRVSLLPSVVWAGRSSETRTRGPQSVAGGRRGPSSAVKDKRRTGAEHWRERRELGALVGTACLQGGYTWPSHLVVPWFSPASTA